MPVNANQTKRLRFWLEISGAIALAAWLVWCVFPSKPSYLNYSDFTNRDSTYYAKVAEACDLLMCVNSDETSYRHSYSGANEILPKVLHDLRATSIEVTSGFADQGNTNQLLSFVFIKMGHSRLGYGISWRLDDLTPDVSKWRLTVANEGGSKVLFEKIISGHTNRILESN